MLPQWHDGGWGGKPFMSVATGLNLALVKFETFFKSLEDVERHFKNDVDTVIDEKGGGTYLADEEVLTVVNREKNTYLAEVKADNSRRWFWARWLAYRMVYWGFGLLFFQCSVGILALIFLTPAAITFSSKRRAIQFLDSKIEAVVRMANTMIENKRKAAPAMEANIVDTLKQDK
jgi:hypothetical protein